MVVHSGGNEVFQASGGEISEVAALARDLASATCRRQVLDALCNSIKRVLGAHAAYAALNRAHATEAVVCSTDGVRTAPFRSLRLPHEAGLGGRVARDGVVRATEDYATDRGLVHSEALDRRVLDEGLRGIVAAPLRTRAAVVGTALAGVRSARRFGPHDVVLLQALCDVAGSALERVEQVRRAERRAADAERRRAEAVELADRRLELLERDSSAVAEARAELLTDLLARIHLDEQEFRARATAACLDPTAAYDVLAVEIGCAVRPAESAHRIRRMVQDGGLAAVHDSREGTIFTALLPAQDRSARDRARELLGSPHEPVTTGVAGPAAGPIELREAIQAAGRAVRLLLALGRRGGTGDAGDLGPLALLAAGSEPDEIAAFLDRVLGPLLATKPPSRDRLLTTLQAWFDHGATVKRVARALGVHTNTVYGRLDKLDAILGPEWQEGARRLELETAVRLQLLGTALSG